MNIADTVEIRGELESDYPKISEVYTLAFHQLNESKLVDLIRASSYYIPALSLVAQINQTVIGHILFSYISLIGQESWPVLALAPLAVHPDYQRQGIGSLLVEKGLEIASRQKESLVIVLGHPEFYRRFGFKTAALYQIECPFVVPEEAFMVKFLTDDANKYQGKVIYPSTFDGVS